MGYDIEKEKREAIEAGRRALNSLQAAKENLNSAKNWGLVDMFGGGFFTTMLKHSKMDQAKQNMEQVTKCAFFFCFAAASPAHAYSGSYSLYSRSFPVYFSRTS